MRQSLGKKAEPNVATDDSRPQPQPPNIFLYIQLALIQSLPITVHPLEIHMEQGDNLIIKCVEHYNTDAIIFQEEFNDKPTYTLIFQQDNLDRINHAADNPLIIKLFLRKGKATFSLEEETLEEVEESEEEVFLMSVIGEVDKLSSEEINYYNEKAELVLLCVGFLDITKLFSPQRCMLREQLSLYPVEDVPVELRFTVLSEWHLYTLLPIAKEVTFTNMAFVTFESIYNIKEEYNLELSSLRAELSFRSVVPNGKSGYHVVPFCSFNHFYESIIAEQKTAQMFESFRNSVPYTVCTGLKSNIDTQIHNLFHQLMCSENMEIDFTSIDIRQDNALICNSFHRFLLTSATSDTLFNAIASRRYLIAVDIWQTTIIEKKVGKQTVKELGEQKVFEGILDTSILLFPEMHRIRFAVELKYTGSKGKIAKTKRLTEQVNTARNPASSKVDATGPTFAIIKLCFFAPLGQVYQELKDFHESFVSQNRLINCKLQQAAPKPTDLYNLQNEIYSRFDTFMRDTIRYIVIKNLHRIEDKQNHFCCALQNLTNLLLKLVGCDFNMRERTKTNLEFTNLCVVAFNELEIRIRNILEKMEEDNVEELIDNSGETSEKMIDFLNAIKLMYAVGDKQMHASLTEAAYANFHDGSFDFFNLVIDMERGNFTSARKFFKSKYQLMSYINKYCAGWIRIYLNYLDTRDDPDPATAAEANECLLNSITTFAEDHDRHSEGWILLYCYYKLFDYPPGYNYARWRLQCQSHCQKGSGLSTPYSMWGIALSFTPVFESHRGHQFFASFKIFVRLGLYEFGQIIFNEIQHECSKEDSYMISTQLKIQLKTLEDDFELMSVTQRAKTETETYFSADGPIGFMAQLYGNVEFYRGNWDMAAKYYEQNISSTIIESPLITPSRDQFLLSKLRYAYLSFNAGNYQPTINALQFHTTGKILSQCKGYLMGKTYYRMEDYTTAIECFANCTTYGTHMPDIWAFLALINLHMGNYMNAINCWKYAKIDPTKAISDEFIFAELNMIDMDSVELYVDEPKIHMAHPLTDED